MSNSRIYPFMLNVQKMSVKYMEINLDSYKWCYISLIYENACAINPIKHTSIGNRPTRENVIWASAWDFQQFGMCDRQSLRSACAYAQSNQSLCQSLEYSMIVKLLTEHFGVSKHNRRLQRLVRVYTCQNVKLLEISCCGSYLIRRWADKSQTGLCVYAVST